MSPRVGSTAWPKGTDEAILCLYNSGLDVREVIQNAEAVGAHIRVHQGLPEGSEVAGEEPGAVHSCGRRGGAEDVEVIDLGGAAGDSQARGKCRRGSTAVGG